MTGSSYECAMKVLEYMVRECRRRKLNPSQEVEVMDILVEELMQETLKSISVNAKEQK